MVENKSVLIFGATGNMGGAAARELLSRGWQVRAVTRNIESEKAQTLSGMGAEVVQGDMDDWNSLERVFEGMKHVFSVQNWVTSGVEGEIRQGKRVADAACAAGVKHLVYGSAGTGDPNTGIAHFDSKLEVEAYMRALQLPFTILRPVPFMELLSEKEFFPNLSIWGMKVKILGWDTPIPWVSVHDLGVAIANIFENPGEWIDQDITLLGDIKTMRECRETFVAVDGKKPFGLALPEWLFAKMAGDDFIKMWRWLDAWIAEQGQQALLQLAQETRRVCPETLDLESWLKMKRNGKGK